jgi:hypothetical protein
MDFGKTWVQIRTWFQMDKSKGDDDLVIVMICCYIKTPIQNRKATWIGPQDLIYYHQTHQNIHIRTLGKNKIKESYTHVMGICKESPTM